MCLLIFSIAGVKSDGLGTWEGTVTRRASESHLTLSRGLLIIVL